MTVHPKNPFNSGQTALEKMRNSQCLLPKQNKYVSKLKPVRTVAYFWLWDMVEVLFIVWLHEYWL